MKIGILLGFLLLGAWPCQAQHIEIRNQPSHVDGNEITLSHMAERRIERFLGHMFPMRQMRRYAREVDDRPAPSRPTERSIAYTVISQEGMRFIVAGYTARWNEPVNVLAIYRMEPAGPNQVWRSRPWQASYSGIEFRVAMEGARNIVLFKEGGAEDGFVLAGIFSFLNEPSGLLIRDLTPSLPWLRAEARFPFHPLYAQRVQLESGEDHSLILTASDEAYNVSMTSYVQPRRAWRYNRTHERFECVRSEHPGTGILSDRSKR